MYVRVCALWGLWGLLQDMVGLGVPGVPRFRQDWERIVPDHLVLASFAEGASSVGLCCSAVGRDCACPRDLWPFGLLRPTGVSGCAVYLCCSHPTAWISVVGVH